MQQKILLEQKEHKQGKQKNVQRLEVSTFVLFIMLHECSVVLQNNTLGSCTVISI